MTAQSFHHGNLRAVLLDRAEAVIEERGADALSLRELARDAGVSHGAPRSHFIDRQALLDALAVQGFERFAARLREAIAGRGGTEQRFRRLARAYVDFAVEHAALMELMFAQKTIGQTDAVRAAAGELFRVLDEAVDGGGSDDERERFRLLVAAMLQGTATLVATGRVSRPQGRRIVDDAVDTMLASELGRTVLAKP